MAEKTIVEKAAETVGYGIAMASDVGGSIKTAFDAARDHGFRGSEEDTCQEGCD